MISKKTAAKEIYDSRAPLVLFYSKEFTKFDDSKDFLRFPFLQESKFSFIS